MGTAQRDITTANFVWNIFKRYLNRKLLLGIYYQQFFICTNINYRAFGEWRLLIFDGFDSHICIDLNEYCLDHKIIPFCLPAHTSHVLQLLDVGVFSPLKKYYVQEVSSVRILIEKKKILNLLAQAHRKAFAPKILHQHFVLLESGLTT